MFIWSINLKKKKKCKIKLMLAKLSAGIYDNA